MPLFLESRWRVLERVFALETPTACGDPLEGLTIKGIGRWIGFYFLVDEHHGPIQMGQ